MQKVLVIGSNSFSGSDFIDLLLSQTDYRVIGISRSAEKKELFLPYKRNKNLTRFRFYQIDLNLNIPELFELFDRERPEYIINFAAQSEVAPSWEHPEQWFQTNSVAVAALGNYLKDQKWLTRYVHISSPEVYGSCEGTVREDAPLNPSTPYAASKASGDLMLFTLVKNYSFPLVMIRSTNVYGAHQQLFKIIPRSIIYLKAGNTIELHGGGKAIKSFIHIRDISQGELAAMLCGQNGEIYHLSPPKGMLVIDAVKKICAHLGKDFSNCTRNVSERPGQDKAYVIDSSKAHNMIGWRQKISFADGLDQVIEWIHNSWKTINKEPLVYVHKP